MASKAAAEADREIRKQGWTVGKTLGQGAFGLVKLVTKGNTSAACKIIAKPNKQGLPAKREARIGGKPFSFPSHPLR